MRKLQEDIKLILDYCNVERAMNFEERKAYNRLLDFTQLHSIYQGIPVEDRLNEQEERIQEVETDKFSFSYTEDYERINNNKLEVLDKHTTIQMNGDRIHIVVIPPKSKPYSFKYYITGITFEANEIKDGDVE